MTFDNILTIIKVLNDLNKFEELFMIRRSIALSIFLSVITLGIYGLFWFYSISNQVISKLDYASIDNPAVNLLFLIITGGLYVFWWNYKVSTYLSNIERGKNIEPDFWAPLFSLFFGMILHQSRINRICATK